MNIQDLASRLENYMDSHNSKRTDHRVSDVNEINMGWETELFTFKTSFTENGINGEQDLVIRIFAGEGVEKKASKEFFLMKQLYEVGYPVPPVYYLDICGEVIDKPFILMKRIQGKTLDAAYRSDSPEDLRIGLTKLIGLFVELHKLESSKFIGVPNLSSVDLDSYLDYFMALRDEYATWMTPLIDWMNENRPKKAHTPLSLCHMDYHGMNVMMEDGRTYVIDWGASVMSDYRMDLAWTILLYSTFGGSMFRAPLIEIYEGLSGEKIEHLEFFEVVATARRITDLVKTIGGGSAGLRSDVVDLMRDQREHFIKVHDFLEERTGIKLKELDELLDSF